MYVASHPVVNGTTLVGTSNVVVSDETEPDAEAIDGQVDPALVAMLSQAGRIGFDTKDIRAALGLCSVINPVALSSNGVIIYARKRSGATLGTLLTQKLAAANGLLIPRSFGATQGRRAMATFEVLASDPSGGPGLAFTEVTQALPTGLSDPDQFTVGPCFIGGVAITKVTSIQVTPNLSPIVDVGDGHENPVEVAISSRMPRIIIEGTDTTLAAELGYGAVEIDADFRVFFRAVTANGLPIADATASHCRIGGTAGIVKITSIGADGRVRILIMPSKPSGSAILSHTLDTAIADAA